MINKITSHKNVDRQKIYFKYHVCFPLFLNANWIETDTLDSSRINFSFGYHCFHSTDLRQPDPLWAVFLVLRDSFQWNMFCMNVQFGELHCLHLNESMLYKLMPIDFNTCFLNPLFTLQNIRKKHVIVFTKIYSFWI